MTFVDGIQWNTTACVRFTDPVIVRARPRLTARVAHGVARIRLWRRRTLVYQHVVPAVEFVRRDFRLLVRLT